MEPENKNSENQGPSKPPTFTKIVIEPLLGMIFTVSFVLSAVVVAHWIVIKFLVGGPDGE